MFHRTGMILALLVTTLLLAGLLPAALADEALDKAFTALKTFDWGQDRSALKAIDDAVVASNADAARRKDLETKLAAVLGSQTPQCAKDFACRKLSLIGTASSVPALAKLLTDEKLSHMSRYALERMSCTEAVQALRDALPKAGGVTKAGIVNSLGVRRDAASLAALAGLLGDANQPIATAAAAALGAIGTAEAATALADFQPKAPAGVKAAVADAQLVCAERLLAAGKKAEALAIYKALSTGDQPKHVKLAATRGLLAAAGRKPGAVTK
jgi:hypothetical protein